MSIFRIRVSIEREVEAEDEHTAAERFWNELEDNNGMENTTTENRLSDSMEIEEV